MNNDIPKPTPVILSETGSNILYPDSTGFVKLRTNEKFRLLCSGTKFQDKYIKPDEISLLITCHKGTTVRIGNRVIAIKRLQCHQYPKSISRLVGVGCYNDSPTTQLIEIGFNVTINNNDNNNFSWKSVLEKIFHNGADKKKSSDKFIRQYSVCFDSIDKVSLYSMYDKSMLASGYQVNKDRGSYYRDYYYDPDGIVESYYWRNERRTLSDILNSTELASTYVNGDEGRFLSRGHLTPRADFVYGFQQAATMYYVNVAPQWQQFNGGNWELLERAVRNFLRAENGLEYKVITGVNGQASLPDANGNRKGLYLYKDNVKKNVTMLTVPKYYWKIVYRKTTRSGIGFIGVNNPYSNNVSEYDRICRRICHSLDWITFDVTDVKKGYVICCDMDELLDYVSLPNNIFLDD